MTLKPFKVVVTVEQLESDGNFEGGYYAIVGLHEEGKPLRELFKGPWNTLEEALTCVEADVMPIINGFIAKLPEGTEVKFTQGRGAPLN